MNADGIASLIGTPWRYPDADCWQIFRAGAWRGFGIEVDAVPVPPTSDPQLAAQVFDWHSQRRYWRRVESPRPGCALLCFDKQTGRAAHIALYCGDGDALHSLGPGRMATLDPLRVLRRMFGKIEYYAYVPDNGI